MIEFVIVINNQRKLRLLRWFRPPPEKDQARVITEVSTLVTDKAAKLCNVIEWRDKKLVYRKYAALCFVFCIGADDNELLTLETIQFYVECLDQYFENVCELDLVFNCRRAQHILDEMIVDGRFCESSKSAILKAIGAHDQLEAADGK